jgi:hypothetical protein
MHLAVESAKLKGIEFNTKLNKGGGATASLLSRNPIGSVIGIITGQYEGITNIEIKGLKEKISNDKNTLRRLEKEFATSFNELESANNALKVAKLAD